jgi:tetratricopeptide (TPR) repeat protein
MNRIAKASPLLLTSLVFIISCSNKKKKNAFEDLLRKAPFAAVTDSVKQFPKNDELYFRRAVLLNSNNQPAAALSDFEKAWSLSHKEQYAMGIGNLLLETSPDSALQFIKKATAELPRSLLLKITLARSLSEAGKTDEALSTCNEILNLNPQQVDILKIKADLLSKKGMNAEAMEVLEKAYTLTPYDIELNYILALNYAENKNSRVLALCDSLIKADSLGTHGEPYYYKGIYYSNIGNKEEALRQFDACIKHDKFFHEGYIEKGAVYFDMKNYAEAFKMFKLCNTLSPDYAPAWYWMAKCQEAAGQKEEAKLNYQKAYGLDNTMTEAKEAASAIK